MEWVPTCVRLVTVVVQVPEKGFPDINDAKHRLGSLEPVAILGP